MHDIMVDLETMGTSPGAAITQIGAVAFDPPSRRFGQVFYRRIDLTSAVESGLTMDTSTVLWWMQQSTEARDEFAKRGETLPYTLDQFSAFLMRLGDTSQLRIWGNGAAFDNTLLAEAYRRCGRPVPWKSWNDRCFRTLKSIGGVSAPDTITPQEFGRRGGDQGVSQLTAVKHNALWDAITQADWCMDILTQITGVPAADAGAVTTYATA